MKYLALKVVLVVVVVSVIYAADEDDLTTGRFKRQSLIPFPRVGRSRHGPLTLSRLPMDSRAFWDLQLEGLREGKRQGLIPFPRVGKRQSLIPFPRVGRDPGQGFADDVYQSERGTDGAEDLYGEFLPVQVTSNDPSKPIQN